MDARTMISLLPPGSAPGSKLSPSDSSSVSEANRRTKSTPSKNPSLAGSAIVPDDRPLEVTSLELEGDEPAFYVEDSYPDSCELRVSFLGLGRTGTRLTEAFHRLGYNRVLTLTDDVHDLAIDPSRIGRIPTATTLEEAESLRGLEEATARALGHTWGEGTDLGLVCLAAGDPLAAAFGSRLTQVARQHAQNTWNHSFHLLLNQPRLGAIVALPSLAEGPKASKIALETLKWLFANQDELSPLIFIDHDHIGRLFGNESPTAFRAAALGLARVFHLFHRQAAAIGAERLHGWSEMLGSGPLYLGAFVARKPNEPSGLAKALTLELNANLFCPAPLSKAGRAALFFLIGEGEARGLSEKTVRKAIQQFQRRLAQTSHVDQIITASQSPGLVVASMISDCPAPVERIMDLAELAGVDPKAFVSSLGLEPNGDVGVSIAG